MKPLQLVGKPTAVLALTAMVSSGTVSKSSATQAPATTRRPDVIFVATPPMVVDAMLKAARVTSDDVVYDLGCGDGRIVIAAAKIYGARGVGIDIDPRRIEEAETKASEEGVSDRVTFKVGDLFETDLSKANVVALYLLTVLNERLRPKLWTELEVGSRVVSHAFNMGDDWLPDQVIIVGGRPVYFWTITKELKQRVTPDK